MPDVSRSEFHQVTTTTRYFRNELLRILGFDPEETGLWVNWTEGNYQPGRKYSGPQLVITQREDIEHNTDTGN